MFIYYCNYFIWSLDENDLLLKRIKTLPKYKVIPFYTYLEYELKYAISCMKKQFKRKKDFCSHCINIDLSSFISEANSMAYCINQITDFTSEAKSFYYDKINDFIDDLNSTEFDFTTKPNHMVLKLNEKKPSTLKIIARSALTFEEWQRFNIHIIPNGYYETSIEYKSDDYRLEKINPTIFKILEKSVIKNEINGVQHHEVDLHNKCNANFKKLI